MTNISWAYIAGFLDGDGWITSSGNRNCATRRYVIGFTQKVTEWPSMKLIHDFLAANGIKVSVNRREVSTPRCPTPVYMVNLHVKEQRSVIKLAAELIPHLVIKKDKAIECLSYTKDRLDKRGSLVTPLHRQQTKTCWSNRELGELVRLQRAGHGNRSIAAKLSRSVNSVAQKLSGLGLVRIANEEP